MNVQSNPGSTQEKPIRFDLGLFEGYNFRASGAIRRLMTAAEVVAWDHDRQGEAEFWPSGDHAGVGVIFNRKSAVTAAELLDLDRLLTELGGDSIENFLRIHYTVNIRGANLDTLSADAVEDHFLHVFLGTSFVDLRKEAAYELFELYYPEAYQAWEKSYCDGLIFDTDRFLDSPALYVEEVSLGEQKALLIAPE